MSEQLRDADAKAKKASFEGNKLTKRLRHHVGDAINDFNMIEEGDRVMVCLSGGKDSYTLLDILLGLQKSAPINFSIVAVNLDQKQPGFPEHVLPDYLQSIGVEYRIVEEDTYSIVKRLVPEGKTTCSLCSRLRRGILYRVADELGATKIALGHHRDDILHTFFLNMFYGGKLKAMPPKLVSDDGRHMVIRPLAYCREKDIERYATLREFPIIPCNLCGSQPNLQRQVVKEMVNDWDKRFPGRVESMFRAMQNVVPSHLADTGLFDFAGLQTGDVPFEGGDTAFDKEEFRDTLALAEDDGDDVAAEKPRRTISILDSRPKASTGDGCGA
ncbi:tRNA 2-thiocytidine(32) synthetase TtcA [Vogesella oryzae]|uniref:tRNA 2-thiocytidine(32) synthetase TtcA n=1 Tax=Vogesella oryzae TaxID=1735285 RepID=UPI0015816410|nr:tRNA 2-thiocytidine(32) synthetase TtcA [Vogesella oryzae]